MVKSIRKEEEPATDKDIGHVEAIWKTLQPADTKHPTPQFYFC